MPWRRLSDKNSTAGNSNIPKKLIGAASLSPLIADTAATAFGKFSSYHLITSAQLLIFSGTPESPVRANAPFATPLRKKHSADAMCQASSREPMDFGSGL